MAGRLLLICCALLGLAQLATGKGNYQSTKNGTTLVWNSDPKPGDIATWSGDRDRDDYARGFGRLIWYTTDPGSSKPELYARYWGRMVNGKFEGPVNVHSKRKTHHAIFIGGTRVTGWSPGTASSQANGQWQRLVAKRREHVEPESPAAGPTEQMPEVTGQRSEDSGLGSVAEEPIQDLYSERWPKIDVDDSLRLLAFPPRTLRSR